METILIVEDSRVIRKVAHTIMGGLEAPVAERSAVDVTPELLQAGRRVAERRGRWRRRCP